jgi:hypothetical protein
MDDSIRVLHVDDEPGLAEVAAEFLERQDDRIEVVIRQRAMGSTGSPMAASTASSRITTCRG